MTWIVYDALICCCIACALRPIGLERLELLQIFGTDDILHVNLIKLEKTRQRQCTVVE